MNSSNKLILKPFIVITLLCYFLTGCDEAVHEGENTKSQITAIMQKQEDCWNTGDLECFMEGYWHSDQLVFIGKSGPKYGWDTTLENYQTSYPDRKTMGKLKFDLLKIDVISYQTSFVIGKWTLKREIGDLSGHFTLLWKKIEGQWTIVADHSS